MNAEEPPARKSDAPDAPAMPPAEVKGSGVVTLVRDLLAIDRGALAILATVPISLTLLEYYGMPWHWTRFSETSSALPFRQMQGAEGRVPPAIDAVVGWFDLPGSPALRPYLWWGLACVVLLILLPMLVGRVFAGMSPRALGLKLAGTRGEAKIYLLLYVLFVPVVYMASRWPGFLNTYPFFPAARRGTLSTEFWVFEGVYCLQFLAIEFFFRGFIVLGLKERLGRASILVMLAPYCMIHYYKPLPEAMGAIGAGLVLGALAWRSGTVIYGWFLHFAIALSMDFFALHARGAL